MRSEAMERIVAAYGDSEEVQDAVVPQGKTQTGRTVLKEPVAVQASSQMAVTSDTYQQTTTRHSAVVGVKRVSSHSGQVASTKKPRSSETNVMSANEINKLRERFKVRIRQLRKTYENAPDELSFCRSVIRTYSDLKEGLHKDKDKMRLRDYLSTTEMLRHDLGKLFRAPFSKALDFFQCEVVAGNGWKHDCHIDEVSKYSGTFNFFPAQDRTTNMDKKSRLKEIWQLYINHEMDYLKYLKQFPEDRHIAERTGQNIVQLVSSESSICKLELMNDTVRETIRQQAMRLCGKITHSGMNDSDAGREQEKPDESRDCEFFVATDMMYKRRTYDQLVTQYEEVYKEYKEYKECESTIDQEVRFLKRLTKLRDRHDDVMNDKLTPLCQNLKIMMSDLTEVVLDKIETCSDSQSRVKAMILMNYLRGKGWMNARCEELYLACMEDEDQDAPGSVVSAKEVLYAQCDGLLDDISRHLDRANRDSCMEAANKLGQLESDYEDKIKTLRKDQKRKLRDKINKLGCMLYDSLFFPVFNEYHKFLPRSKQGSGFRQLDYRMEEHKDDLVQLYPYTFILNSQSLYTWDQTVCAAWYNDVDWLRQKKSFGERDVDVLLTLEHIEKNLNNARFRQLVEQSLKQLFQFVLRINPSAIPIEKVAKLSEWVNYLDRRNPDIDQLLCKYNDEWRKKYMSTVGERAMVASDTAAESMPSFVYPDAVGASSGARGGRTHVGQRNTSFV